MPNRSQSGSQIKQSKAYDQAAFSQQLVNLTALLNAEVELPKILEIICAETTKLMNVDAVQVTLYDSQNDVFTAAHVHSLLKDNNFIREPYSLAAYKPLRLPANSVL